MQKCFRHLIKAQSKLKNLKIPQGITFCGMKRLPSQLWTADQLSRWVGRTFSVSFLQEMKSELSYYHNYQEFKTIFFFFPALSWSSFFWIVAYIVPIQRRELRRAVHHISYPNQGRTPSSPSHLPYLKSMCVHPQVLNQWLYICQLLLFPGCLIATPHPFWPKSDKMAFDSTHGLNKAALWWSGDILTQICPQKVVYKSIKKQ